jgi:hypothetical protein
MSDLNIFRETFHPRRPPRRRSISPAVEGLDQRTLLSAGISHAMVGHVAVVSHERQSEHNGTVVKTPRFYEDYVGPQLAQLDAVKASGQLLSNGSFSFLLVNQGAINPNVRATYVFGVDRSGNLPPGPFPGRPGIQFDATVVVKIVPGQATTVTVNDMLNKTTTTVQNPALQISGKKVSVVIPGSLLPSKILDPAHYRFAAWPEDGLAGSTHIASFAPEFNDLQVGHQSDSEHNGTVVVTPRFYEDYVGPQLAQLDAVKATGQLRRDGSFSFVGVNQGAIDPNVPATYVFGVDRSGHLPTGPFPGRPDIQFDATVVVKIVPGQATTVTVNDMANKTSTTVQNPALQISGKKVSVVIPGSLLPSTGLAASHFRYAFWPEDGLAGSTHIASFAPQFNDIRVAAGRG